jgi:hypothetical protein
VNQRIPRPSAATANAFPWAEFILSRIDSVKPAVIEGSLNRDAFLRLLNTNRKTAQNTVDVNFIARLRVSAVAKALGFQHFANKVSLDAQLRLYVDDWLRTGRTKDGVETPTARDLTKAPTACEAIRSFANRQRLWLEPKPDGLHLYLPNELTPDTPPGRQALETADRVFALFLMCEWRSKLAKCRSCGRYFELKHWNRTYKRGTLCPKCQRAKSIEGAKHSTSTARRAAVSELYRLAGRGFARQIVAHPEWRDDPKLKTEIIQYLNSRIFAAQDLRAVYPRGITEKWLGWAKNRNGIEHELKKGKHAKS